MPELEQNNYLGKKLTRYQTFKTDPNSGLYQIRKYNPRIKLDPIKTKRYNKLRDFSHVKYGVKPINDVLTKQVRDYNVKKYDHFFEYNQAQDELEEQQKEVERVVKQEEKQEEKFFPDKLWMGTIGTVQRNLMLLTPIPKTPSPMQYQEDDDGISPMQSPVTSPVQSELITPTAIATNVDSPKPKPKKVVIQETPVKIPDSPGLIVPNIEIPTLNIPQESPRSTTLVPSIIDINYSSARWNDF